MTETVFWILGGICAAVLVGVFFQLVRQIEFVLYELRAMRSLLATIAHEVREVNIDRRDKELKNLGHHND